MLSVLQKKIVESDAPKIVVKACSASGKTFTLTERIRRMLKIYDPQDIAIITYTNLAAEEMRKRLGDDYREGLYIGTIHALANYMLQTAGISTGALLIDNKFDDLFVLIKENPECVRHYKYIFLDEAQDTAANQFEFIHKIINPEGFFIVGDTRQSIYQWNGALPELFNSLTWRSDVVTFDLNENYRNDRSILQFAKSIIYRNEPDNSVSATHYNGIVEDISEDKNYVIKLITQSEDYKNWAILTRTNDQLAQYQELLLKHNIPCSTFHRAEMTTASLQQEMEANTVKVLTIHCSKGLEWDNVVVIGAQFYSAEENCISYVAATRAKHHLIWMRPRKTRNKIKSWE